MWRRLLPLLILFCLVSAAFAAPRTNVILITLDSTRADRMGFLGSKSGLTPSLDSLAKRSVIFENAYAQAPLTTVSHATILTGLYPQAHGVSEFGTPLAAKLPYLPDLMRSAGYRTAAFVGTIQLDPRQGFAPGFLRGFEAYDAPFHDPGAGESRYSSIERRAGAVEAQAEKWIRGSAGKPFFVWIEMNDPHVPYQPVPPYSRRRGSPYDGEIASVDGSVGKLISALDAQKLTANTLIVVTADHGESLGDHGEDTHGVFLYDETIHVPLLVKLPNDQLAGKRVPARVQLVDVAPTVLDVAGVAVPPAMQGGSLTRVARGNSSERPAYARTEYPNRAFGWSMLESWRTGKYLLIRAPKPELYDLSKDPAEKQNLAGSMKATMDTLAGQLESFDKRLSGSENSAAQLSPSEIQKLASLGYVGLQQQKSGSATVSGEDPKDKIVLANSVQKAVDDVESGRAKAAMSSLNSAVGQDSKAFLAYYALGTAYLQAKQYPHAVESLRKAVGLLPDSGRANYEMGLALTRAGNWKDSATHLEIAVARLPEFSEAHTLLADAYTHLGRTTDAQRERAQAKNQ